MQSGRNEEKRRKKEGKNVVLFYIYLSHIYKSNILSRYPQVFFSSRSKKRRKEKERKKKKKNQK